MIVWSEKKGHRRHQPEVASRSIRRIKNEEIGKTATTITDKAQITKTSTTLNEETSPVNPHDSAPLV